MRRFLSTLDAIDVLYLVYSNFVQIKGYSEFVNDHFFKISFYFNRKFERTKYKYQPYQQKKFLHSNKKYTCVTTLVISFFGDCATDRFLSADYYIIYVYKN